MVSGLKFICVVPSILKFYLSLRIKKKIVLYSSGTPLSSFIICFLPEKREYITLTSLFSQVLLLYLLFLSSCPCVITSPYFFIATLERYKMRISLAACPYPESYIFCDEAYYNHIMVSCSIAAKN